MVFDIFSCFHSFQLIGSFFGTFLFLICFLIRGILSNFTAE